MLYYTNIMDAFQGGRLGLRGITCRAYAPKCVNASAGATLSSVARHCSLLGSPWQGKLQNERSVVHCEGFVNYTHTHTSHTCTHTHTHTYTHTHTHTHTHALYISTVHICTCTLLHTVFRYLPNHVKACFCFTVFVSMLYTC